MGVKINNNLKYILEGIIGILAFVFGWIICEIIRRYIWKDKKPPERMQNEFKKFNKNFIQIVGEKNVVICIPILKKDFIKIEKTQPIIKNKKIKIRLCDNYEKRAFIESSRSVYPQIHRLLTQEISRSLQLYISQKGEEYKEFISDGIEFVKKNNPNIYSWIEIFRILDNNQNLEGIVLPIAKQIKENDNKTKLEFIQLIKLLGKQNILLENPIKVGNHKIGIIFVGEKNWKNYFLQLCSLKRLRCDIFILAARGLFINNATNVSEIFKRLFSKSELVQENIIKSIQYKENRVSCIYIVLKENRYI